MLRFVFEVRLQGTAVRSLPSSLASFSASIIFFPISREEKNTTRER